MRKRSARFSGAILAFARTPFAIDRLLALGAPIDLADRWGSKPIDAMSRLGPRGRSLVERLAARGAAAAPKAYARVGDVDTLAHLVAADPAVARRDDVMMAAAEGGHHDPVAWLLARDGAVNARADAASRHTALHAAAWNGDLRMARLLVEAGADQACRDDQHDGTALDWAATSSEVTNNPTCADVVAYLEGAAGANVREP
jgi:hypothetical protein